MVRFLHAADIHLDSPMRRLQFYEGAPEEEIRGSTRQALSNLIDLAITQQVDFVLIAGDLYDGDWKDHNTGLFFARQVSRLLHEGIALYFISGNHDAASKLTKALPLPNNPDGSPIQLATDHVQTVIREKDSVAIHGQGFARAAETENLAREYPAASSGLINIGMLHTSLQGEPGHAPYAPCTPQQLADKSYDYWALGHIHLRGDRSVSGSCPIMYSGNPQGRNVGECGEKGCLLVETDEVGRPSITFCPLDVCRWEVCKVDATEIEHTDDLINDVMHQFKTIADRNGTRTSLIRTVVIAEGELYANLLSRADHWQNVLRQSTFELVDNQVWMERLKLQRAPAETASSSGLVDPMTDLMREVASDPATREALAHVLGPLANKLPPELLEGADAMDFVGADQLDELLRQARPLLETRLRSFEGVK